MKWRVISASVRGSSHQRTGMPNQDAIDYGVSGKGDANVMVLAVSDGHGSGKHFRSQVGSTLAVHVAVKVMQASVATAAIDEPGWLTQVAQQLVEAWLAAVRSDLGNNPFTEAELGALATAEGTRSCDSVLEAPELAYGATLLVAAVTDTRMVYLQLGDGDILTVYGDGTTVSPIAVDERLVGNQTTSLCQPEAWREIRTADVHASEGLPLLVLLSTDGYVNSFRSQEDFVRIGQDYLQILREQGSEMLSEELPRILSEATQQGSGDDITLGMLHAEVLASKEKVIRPGGAASTKQEATPSVMIRELTKERSTQQKKLTELESSYAGVRRHVLQLRLLVGAVLLAAVALGTQQYWMPGLRGLFSKTHAPIKEPRGGVGTEIQKKPGKGEREPVQGEPKVGKDDPEKNPDESPDQPVESAPPVVKPAVPVAAGLGEGEWVLTLNGGREVALTAGKTLTTVEIFAGEDKHAYGKVKKQDGILLLTNLSSDAWTVTSATTGKKMTFSNGDSVPVRADTTIAFRKSAKGSIRFRIDKPA